MEQTTQNQPQPQPQQAQVQNQPQAGSSGSMKLDDKTIATIKASAIWGAVAAAITSLASMVTTYLFIKKLYSNLGGGLLSKYLEQSYAPQMIDFGVLITSLFYGAIGGAIAGWVIAKFYPVLAGWQKKYLANKLNSFFKLLFWPYVAGYVISLLSVGFSIAGSRAFMMFLLNLVVDVIAAFVYAKMMDKAVGKYYQ